MKRRHVSATRPVQCAMTYEQTSYYIAQNGVKEGRPVQISGFKLVVSTAHFDRFAPPCPKISAKLDADHAVKVPMIMPRDVGIKPSHGSSLELP